MVQRKPSCHSGGWEGNDFSQSREENEEMTGEYVEPLLFSKIDQRSVERAYASVKYVVNFDGFELKL